MSNLPLVDPATASGAAAELLAAVQANLGIIPNMTKAMANSPAALKSYLEFSGALAAGALRPAVREQLALAIAQRNSCGYCLSAHTYIGEHMAKLSTDEIADARRGTSEDPKVAALLSFAVAVNAGRGDVSAADVDAVRQAGATDAEIAETIAHVALNVLTNYFNKTADVAIDFPLVTV